MSTLHCIVKGCGVATTKFSLPSHEDVCHIWLVRSGNIGWVLPESKRQYNICPKHFAKICFATENRLKELSLPSLHLPAFTPTNTSSDWVYITESQPSSSGSTNKSTPIEEDPTTSRMSCHSPVGEVKKPQKTYTRVKRNQTGPLKPSTETTSDDAARCRTEELEQEAYNKRILDVARSKQIYLHLIRPTDPVGALLLISQLRNIEEQPENYKFTSHDKAFALTMYRMDPTVFRILSNHYILPTVDLLRNTLNNARIMPGIINQVVFDQLKISRQPLRRIDRKCILLFHEVAVKPALRYNKRYDMVEGFVDSTVDGVQFADRALVFMIKGIRGSTWQQPVFYQFYEKKLSISNLVDRIKLVITELQKSGLIVIATMSDQSRTNQDAIRSLVGDFTPGQLLAYRINRQQIVHMYDPARLMQSMRDGLLIKDLKFSALHPKTKCWEDGIASWKHLMEFYEVDQNTGNSKMCPWLTEKHVIPSQISKTKLKLAIDVFSQPLGARMYMIGEFSTKLDPSRDDYLDPKAMDTAKILVFFDELFDSVSGTKKCPPSGKPLKRLVTRRTGHINHWKIAITTLESMRFIADRPGSRALDGTIHNFTSTMRGFLHLGENLLKALPRWHFTPAKFNQDIMDEFCSKLQNATCYHLTTAFRTHWVNSCMSKDGTNCDEDDPFVIVNRQRTLINNIGKSKLSQNVEDLQRGPVVSSTISDEDVVGEVVRQYQEKFPCNSCIDSSSSSLYDCDAMMKEVAKSIHSLISGNIQMYNIRRTLLQELLKENHKLPLCSDHQQTRRRDLLIIILDLIFFKYIKNINRVLKGRSLRLKDTDDNFRKANTMSGRKRAD